MILPVAGPETPRRRPGSSNKLENLLQIRAFHTGLLLSATALWLLAGSARAQGSLDEETTRLRTIERQIEPIFSEGLFQAREQIEYFAEIQGHTGDESGGVDPRMGKKATRTALKLIGKLGPAGKAVAKGAKQGLRAQKQLGTEDRKRLDEALEKAAEAYTAYKEGLKNLAFNVDALKLSYDETAHAFTHPDRLSSGDGAGAQAWAAVVDLQRILGRPSKDRSPVRSA